MPSPSISGLIKDNLKRSIEHFLIDGCMLQVKEEIGKGEHLTQSFYFRVDGRSLIFLWETLHSSVHFSLACRLGLVQRCFCVCYFSTKTSISKYRKLDVCFSRLNLSYLNFSIFNIFLCIVTIKLYFLFLLTHLQGTLEKSIGGWWQRTIIQKLKLQ